MNRRAQQELQERAAAAAGPAIRRGFLLSVARLRAAVPKGTLREAVAAGDDGTVMVLVDRALAAEPWRPLELAMNRALAGAGQNIGEGVADTVLRKREARWGFNPFAPGVLAAAQAWVRPLLARLTDGVRAVALAALIRARAADLPPVDIARDVLEALGLRERQVVAAANMRSALAADADRAMAEAARSGDAEALRRARRRPGLPRVRIEERVAAYRRNALAERGRAIGTNEGRRAAAIAADAAWRQAAEDGLIDPATTVKRWNHLNDGRVRDAHVTIPVLSPRGVPLLARFPTGDGRSIAHPHEPGIDPDLTQNCRCFLSVSIAPRVA